MVTEPLILWVIIICPWIIVGYIHLIFLILKTQKHQSDFQYLSPLLGRKHLILTTKS